MTNPAQGRSLIKGGAVTVAGACALPRFSIGKPDLLANRNRTVVIVVADNIAKMAYGHCKKENVVALCDVDSRMSPAFVHEAVREDWECRKDLWS